MKKEVFFAIIIGSILGLVVAFGVWRANASLKPGQAQTQATKTPVANHISSPSPGIKTNKQLSVTTPNQSEVVTQGSITVAGLTKPDSYILVWGEKGDKLIKSSASGDFSTSINLAEGINYITVKAFEKNLTPYEAAITIVYDSSLGQAGATSAPKAQNASDSIREKVQQKLDQVTNKPQAIIGTVTDKTSSGFHVRNGNSEIKQIAVEEKQTLFIKSGTTNKSIPFADVAIGDFVAAVGFNTTGTLEATRVLIDNSKASQNRKLIAGRVTKSSSREFTLGVVTGIDQKDLVIKQGGSTTFEELLPDSQVATIKISAIKAGSVILATAIVNGTTTTIQSVYLVESQKSPSPTPRTTPKATPR